MKNLDNHIQDILNSKLGNLETEVSPHVWSGIESQLAQQAAAAGTTAVAKTIAAKWLWAAAISAAVTVATVAIVQLNKDEQPIASPTIEQMNTPVAQLPTENSENKAQVADDSSIEITSDDQQKTTAANNSHPQSTGPEHNLEITTDFVPHSPPRVLPSSSPEMGSGASEQGSGPSSAGNTGNPAGPLTNPSYNGSQETATANFTPVVVNQKDLRYYFIPEFTQGVEYEWNMGDGTVYDQPNPTHEYAEEGEYLVTLNVADGGRKVYIHNVTVKAFKPVEVKIPTIFSPNGDGKNDTFEFEVVSGQVEWTKIVIQNGSGTVFESNGEEMWIGKDRQGNECAEGTYTYFVRALDRNQAVIEKTGVVTLRR